uniref:ORF7 n=1 Tax=Nitrosopumilaceae spindle-shaped virus TaxID=3065433 RepID=A0AAT9JAZ9_9VIRU
MILLSGSGVDILLNVSNVTTNEFVINGTTGDPITNSTVTTTSTDKFVLQNPIWITMHYMFALIMFAYVTINILKMLSSKE